jgi:hypothetical protein
LLEEALKLKEQQLPFGDPALRPLKHKIVTLHHILGLPLPPTWPLD